MDVASIEKLLLARKALEDAQATFEALTEDKNASVACAFAFEMGLEVSRLEYEIERARMLQASAEAQANHFLARQMAVEKVLFNRTNTNPTPITDKGIKAWFGDVAPSEWVVS